MKILFAASEVFPFLKTGGLADVAYALPKALRKLGIDVRVIMPLYENIPEKFKSQMTLLESFDVPIGWRNQYCGIKYLEYDSIPFYFIDNEYYFKRTGAYGYDDDGERFAFFSKAILRSIQYLKDFNPDIIHCNDWQTAVIPALLKDHYRFYGNYSHIKTIYTIHNMRYQGIYGKEVLSGLLNLNEGYCTEDAFKYYDGISFMKGGIVFSDIVSTVSSTYAEEIKTPSFGEGLHGMLQTRGSSLLGIVNGIDFDLFNPEKDKAIFANFSSTDVENKAVNKEKLQAKLKLTVDRNIPMIGIVSRLVDQKGFDLIADIITELMSLNVQLVVLGTGDKKYEELFLYYNWRFPEKLSANIFFDNNLAQNIYAATDMFLMPSQFEPCGIGQLIALRYGSIPIVRETGGLKDTVHSYNEYSHVGNGFSFTNYNSHDMLHTIKRALYFYEDKPVWSDIVQKAMEENNSWEDSAVKYSELYNKLI